MTDIVNGLRDMLPDSGFAPTENWLPYKAADEIERLRDELQAARKVVYEAYWNLAYRWQSHMFGDHPARPVEMRVFAPEAYKLMSRSDQELHDALKNYANTREKQ